MVNMLIVIYYIHYGKYALCYLLYYGKYALCYLL